MAAKPTNQDLSKEIKGVKKEVHTLAGFFDTFKTEVRTELKTLHDFMIVAQDRDIRAKGGNGITLPKEVIKLLLYLSGIIAALVGARELL